MSSCHPEAVRAARQPCPATPGPQSRLRQNDEQAPQGRQAPLCVAAFPHGHCHNPGGPVPLAQGRSPAPVRPPSPSPALLATMSTSPSTPRSVAVPWPGPPRSPQPVGNLTPLSVAMRCPGLRKVPNLDRNPLKRTIRAPGQNPQGRGAHQLANTKGGYKSGQTEGGVVFWTSAPYHPTRVPPLLPSHNL